MSNKGQFKKGNIPWNKNKKGIHLSPKSEFKDGVLFGDIHPSWTGGIQKMTSDCTYLYNGCNQRLRKPRVIYEENFGKIPKGFVIWHKDGDRYNDNPDNLEAISRAEMLHRNQINKRGIE